MRLGILGGSFNPVHNGHLFFAEKAISELKLDRVVFVPAYRSPFKPDAVGMETGAADRLLMLAAAIEGNPRLTIDDCEIRREGVSYTVHTLEDIIERYFPDGKPYLLIGDDLAADFPKWRDSDRILAQAEIVIARRLNNEPDTKEHPYPHKIIDNETMDVSSQMIRKMIAENTNWEELVPPSVRDIIRSKKLYSLLPAPCPLSPATCYLLPATCYLLKIEQAARETLSMPRFLHSRNTALLVYDMCRRFQNAFGIEPMDGYLAGIAHDLAKQLDPKEMTKLVKKDGNPITALEKDKPNLLHGRAAAVLLREHFSIHNKDILEAVALHTMASREMGPLAKIVYIADKVEVSRSSVVDLRKMCYDESVKLDDIFYAVVKKTVSKLQSKELDLSEETLKLLEKMKEINN
ncbi:MAG: nicotinate (nicotinamide) nucleotide adenylyltransferase [Treponema sp.]|nr:nicotinate (nicotinamide) nucleotide adenylyltransferase [Treponema sp.]